MIISKYSLQRRGPHQEGMKDVQDKSDTKVASHVTEGSTMVKCFVHCIGVERDHAGTIAPMATANTSMEDLHYLRAIEFASVISEDKMRQQCNTWIIPLGLY